MHLKTSFPILIIIVASFLSLTTLNTRVTAEENTSSSSNSIIVQTIPGPTVAQKITDQAHTSWPWYLTRGSGMIAAAALVILMLSGIGQVTGYTYKYIEPLTAWASHRALGIIFGLSVLVHMFSLLFDHFLPFSFSQILVPWLSNYKPVTLFGWQLGSLYVAMGVIAFYLTVLVVVTSLLWVEKKPYLWKTIHLLSYLVLAMVFVHALYVGTDTSHGWVRSIWIAGAGAILLASVHRLWRIHRSS